MAEPLPGARRPARAPGEGRYARVEREQRWLLAAVPAGAGRDAEILDRYITGTRLRLRRVERQGEIVCKLGQKVRVEDDRPEVVKLTNIYLAAAEYAALLALPAAAIRKTRWRLTHEQRPVAVDRFHGRHDGLVLAEVELSPAEPRLDLPGFAIEDVTDDDRYSGGRLALASDDEVKALLGRVTRLRPA